MITCPKCQHKEPSGALYCTECGEPLAFTDKLSASSTRREEEIIKSFQFQDEELISSQRINQNTQISLLLIDNGRMIPLVGRTELTMGRITEGQPILPDLDLTPFEAYSQGVSRLHAAIKFIEERMVIVDLGSSNGTRVNGQKILPNIEYPIKPGDTLALGRLRMQILIK